MLPLSCAPPVSHTRLPALGPWMEAQGPPDPWLNCVCLLLVQLSSLWTSPEPHPGMTAIPDHGLFPKPQFPHPHPKPLRTGPGSLPSIYCRQRPGAELLPHCTPGPVPGCPGPLAPRYPHPIDAASVSLQLQTTSGSNCAPVWHACPAPDAPSRPHPESHLSEVRPPQTLPPRPVL